MEDQIQKPKRNIYKIIVWTLVILVILGALVYGILYVKSYYQTQAYQIGYQVGVEQVIGLQNQNAQWYYLVGNATNYTIQNVSVTTLCGSLK